MMPAASKLLFISEPRKAPVLWYCVVYLEMSHVHLFRSDAAAIGSSDFQIRSLRKPVLDRSILGLWPI